MQKYLAAVLSYTGRSVRFSVLFETLHCVLEALQRRYSPVLVTLYCEYKQPGNTIHGISDLNSCHLSLNGRIETTDWHTNTAETHFRRVTCAAEISLISVSLWLVSLWRNGTPLPFYYQGASSSSLQHRRPIHDNILPHKRSAGAASFEIEVIVRGWLLCSHSQPTITSSGALSMQDLP